MAGEVTPQAARAELARRELARRELARRETAKPAEVPMVNGMRADTPIADRPAFEMPSFETENKGRALVQGLGAGVAQTLGMGADIVRGVDNLAIRGINKVAGTEIPYIPEELGSLGIRNLASDAAESTGYDVMDEAEFMPEEQAVRRMGEFVGGALSVGGPTALGVRGTKQVVTEGAPIAQRLLGALTNPYRAAPVRAVTNDVASAVGAGAANEVGNDYIEGDGIGATLGRIGLTLMGGAGGAGLAEAGQTVVRGAGNRIRNAVAGTTDAASPQVMEPSGLMRDGGYTRREMDDAARVAQSSVRDPGREADIIEREAANFRAIPGATPESMPTTGLLSPEQDVRLQSQDTRSRLLARDEARERDEARQSLAARRIDAAAPEDARARDLTDFAEQTDARRVGEARTAVEDVNARGRAIEADMGALAGDMLPLRGRQAETSRALDDQIVEGGLRPATERSARRYGAVDPTGQAMVDTSGLLETAGRVRGSLGDVAAPEDVLPASILQRLEGTAGTPARTVESPILGPDGRPIRTEIPATPNETSVGDLVQAIPGLSRREAQARSAQKFELADNLRSLRQQMDRTIRDAPDSEAKTAYLEARQGYDDEIVPAYGGGPGSEGQRLRKDFLADPQNRSKSAPSDTAGRFLRPGDPERGAALDRVVQAAGNPEAARGAVRQHMIAEMASSVIDANGRVNPSSAARFAAQWGSTLERFPEIRDEIQTLARTARTQSDTRTGLIAEAKAAAANLDQVRKDKGALGLVLGREPTKAVADVLGSKDPERALDGLLREVGPNKAARDGLKAATRDWIQENTAAIRGLADDSGGTRASAAKFETTMRRNDALLAKVYAPDEMRALQEARKLLQVDTRVGIGSTPGSQTAANAYLMAKRSSATMIERTIEAGLKLKYGALKGGGIMRSFKLAKSALTNEKQPVQEIIDRLTFDPELAVHLLRRPVAEIGTPKWNRALSRILASGAEYRQNGGDGSVASAPAAVQDDDDPGDHEFR